MKNLLTIVDKAAADGGGNPVSLVHLRIGEMAGVNADALRFAFEVMAKGTAAEGAALEIETVPLRVRCRGCGAEGQPRDFVFVCGACGGSDVEILGGREMEVDYILVRDAATDAGAADA
ncbi:MAG: hydrogenase maturation nickel metallochaperone HypA [Candidatus Krumholzibacteriaceae bacterium]|jgi:hydrogenase nickel incorporation protein HypA/HybF